MKCTKLNLAVLFSLCFAFTSTADTFIFTGSGDWNDPAHWDPHFPGKIIPSGDEVFVDGIAQTADEITINPGATLIINAGASLTYFAAVNLFNMGDFVNYGDFNNLTSFFSVGNVNNEGVFNNYSLINNQGFFFNNGVLYSEATFTNHPLVSIFDNTWGTLQGKGVFNGFPALVGTIEPSGAGASARFGTMSFSGSVDLSNATINLEMGGMAGGTEFDSIAVANELTLINATINVSLAPGYDPADILPCTILKFQSRSGALPTNITLPPNVGFQWEISWTASAAIISSSLLPVELTRFEASQVGPRVDLSWSTASELNNRGFQVLHSTDGQYWHKVGYLEGYGTTYEVNDYIFKHLAPRSGMNYYKLMQEDINGQSDYSKVVTVNFLGEGHAFPAVNVYPNPATSFVNITLDEYLDYKVEIYDEKGRTLLMANNLKQVDVDDFPNGTYYLLVKDLNNAAIGETKNIVVSR